MERSLKLEPELAPGNFTALRRAGIMASARGRIEEAVGLYRRALEQDPLSAATYQNLVIVLAAANRLTEAEAALRKALELGPQAINAHVRLSLVLVTQGRGEEALAEAMREPDQGYRSYAQAIVHHAMDHRTESEASLRELIEKHAEDAAYQVAEVHGARGEAHAAFEWLERAYAQRDGGLTLMRSSRHLRSLHGDPRWGAFLKRMGLED